MERLALKNLTLREMKIFQFGSLTQTSGRPKAHPCDNALGRAEEEVADFLKKVEKLGPVADLSRLENRDTNEPLELIADLVLRELGQRTTRPLPQMNQMFQRRPKAPKPKKHQKRHGQHKHKAVRGECTRFRLQISWTPTEYEHNFGGITMPPKPITLHHARQNLIQIFVSRDDYGSEAYRRAAVARPPKASPPGTATSSLRSSTSSSPPPSSSVHQFPPPQQQQQ